jgi:hypothetical protein
MATAEATVKATAEATAKATAEATATRLRAWRWLVAGVINRVMMSLYIR